MIRTRFCELLGVEHPVALGGMGSVYDPPLVAAASEAGALGALGCHGLSPDQIRAAVKDIRARTSKPFALNFLLFVVSEESFAAALAEKPAALAFAWPRGSQDIKPFIDRAHGIGAKVTFMVSDVPGAKRAAAAGADVIIAQGTEGGGHVAWMGSIALTPMVVDAVGDIPVLTAGGVADGRGLAAALSLGASGVLMGTRFLASEESPLHANYKQAIVKSDGHDTMLTEIPDIAMNLVWPGAMSRSRRNKFLDRWAGREWALRQNQPEVLAGVQAARRAGDTEEAPMSYGQDAGLINEVLPAREIVRRVVSDAAQILSKKLPALLR